MPDPINQTPANQKKDRQKESESALVLSYTTLRNLIRVMLICVALLLIIFLLQDAAGSEIDFPVVSALEMVALEAFGISWLTKGEPLLPDGEHYMVKALREVKENLKSEK